MTGGVSAFGPKRTCAWHYSRAHHTVCRISDGHHSDMRQCPLTPKADIGNSHVDGAISPLWVLDLD
jgi:hypothetical protein